MTRAEFDLAVARIRNQTEDPECCHSDFDALAIRVLWRCAAGDALAPQMAADLVKLRETLEDECEWWAFA